MEAVTFLPFSPSLQLLIHYHILHSFLVLFINASFKLDCRLRFSQRKYNNLVLYSLNFVSTYGSNYVMDKCIVGHAKVTASATNGDVWRQYLRILACLLSALMWRDYTNQAMFVTTLFIKYRRVYFYVCAAMIWFLIIELTFYALLS